jgi:hypothetical protein
MRRDFSLPDSRFDCLNLAKKWANTIEFMMPPMLKQTHSFGGNMPVIGVGQVPPLVYLSAELIDDRGGVILLVCRRKAFSFVENYLLLNSACFAFSRLWNRSDELCAAAAF